MDTTTISPSQYHIEPKKKKREEPAVGDASLFGPLTEEDIRNIQRIAADLKAQRKYRRSLRRRERKAVLPLY